MSRTDASSPPTESISHWSNRIFSLQPKWNYNWKLIYINWKENAMVLGCVCLQSYPSCAPYVRRFLRVHHDLRDLHDRRDQNDLQLIKPKIEYIATNWLNVDYERTVTHRWMIHAVTHSVVHSMVHSMHMSAMIFHIEQAKTIKFLKCLLEK